MNYHKKIKELRKSKKLKQYDLANMIYVASPYVSMIEGGKRDIHISLLMRIADALEVDIKYFFEDNDKHQFKIGTKCRLKYLKSITYTISDIDNTKKIAFVTTWGKESFPVPFYLIEEIN